MKTNKNTEFFFEIPFNSAIANAAWEVIEDGGGWATHKGFTVKQLTHKALITDPVLNALSKKYALFAVIYKMNPNAFCDWHTDDDRNCALNMLLSDSPSHTVFSHSREGATGYVTELHYKPNTLFLFNANKQHMVLNLEKPRYLLSISFLDFVRYEDVLADMTRGAL